MYPIPWWTDGNYRHVARIESAHPWESFLGQAALEAPAFPTHTRRRTNG
jgi:hypothetical protein